MNTCPYLWCEQELRVQLDESVIIRHRGTIARISKGSINARITVTVLGEDDPIIGVEAETRGGDSSTSRSILTLDATNAKQIASCVVTSVDAVRNSIGDPAGTGDILRERAEDERAKHGPYLWMGPFDEAPYGLADQVTRHFTANEGTTDRGTSWLLGMLASRHVETGETDRDIAREIVDVLGPDAAQVVGGWLFRAE